MTLKKHKLLRSVLYGVQEFQKGVVFNAVGTSAKTSNLAFETTEMVYGLRRDERYCGAVGTGDKQGLLSRYLVRRLERYEQWLILIGIASLFGMEISE
jgi:hypothetical protein